jgi:hypothetical protein
LGLQGRGLFLPLPLPLPLPFAFALEGRSAVSFNLNRAGVISFTPETRFYPILSLMRSPSIPLKLLETPHE